VGQIRNERQQSLIRRDQCRFVRFSHDCRHGVEPYLNQSFARASEYHFQREPPCTPTASTVFVLLTETNRLTSHHGDGFVCKDSSHPAFAGHSDSSLDLTE
jgi:hypothetical protein